jgi:hypothetical protein
LALDFFVDLFLFYFLFFYFSFFLFLLFVLCLGMSGGWWPGWEGLSFFFIFVGWD